MDIIRCYLLLNSITDSKLFTSKYNAQIVFKKCDHVQLNQIIKTWQKMTVTNFPGCPRKNTKFICEEIIVTNKNKSQNIATIN